MPRRTRVYNYESEGVAWRLRAANDGDQASRANIFKRASERLKARLLDFWGEPQNVQIDYHGDVQFG